MRIALISAIGEGRAPDGAARLIAGRSVAHRQIDLALELGCERIACFAEAPTEQLLRLQQAAERSGAIFNAIPNGRGLAGLVKAADELLVLAPELLADAAFVAETLGHRPGILVVPADKGVAQGFERIDHDDAWAGVMLLSGAAADRLAELPSENDPISSLLRVALQTGTRRVHLASATLDSGEINLVRDSEARARAEKRWLERSAIRIGWRRPASAAIGAIVRKFASGLLANRRSAMAADSLAAAFAVGAGALAWAERPAAGLALLTAAAGAFLCARLLRGFERGSLKASRASAWGDWLVDAVFTASVVMAEPRNPGWALFAAFVAVVAGRLAAVHGPDASIAPAGDRVLVLVIFALAAALGKLLPAVQLFVVVVVVLDLFLRTRTRLTPA